MKLLKGVVLTIIIVVLVTATTAQNACNISYAAFTAMTTCREAVESVIQFINFPNPTDLETACSTGCEALWRTALTDCGPVSYVDLKLWYSL